MSALASLRLRAVDVTIGAWAYTIPAYPADRWIEALLDPAGPRAIVPGMLGADDQVDVNHRWVTGDIDADTLVTAARSAVGTAAGRFWWEATRIVELVTEAKTWPILYGRLLRSGVRLDQVSLSAFCDVIWSMLMENANDEQRHQIEMELSLPPADVEVDEMYDEEREAAAFEAELQAAG